MKIVKHHKDFNDDKKIGEIEVLSNNRIITKIIFYLKSKGRKTFLGTIAKELNVPRKTLWAYENETQKKNERFIGVVAIWCIKNDIDIKDFLTNKDY